MARKTTIGPYRHGFLTPRLRAGLVLLLSLPVADVAVAGDWQPLADIEAKAQAQARAMFDGADVRVSTRIGALDSRLRFPRCERPLEAFSPGSVEIKQNVVVGVRCRGSRPWQVYVPVRVAAFRPVLVTRRPLSRGSTVDGGDVRVEERDVAVLHRAYLTDPAQLRGQVLRRSVPEGRVLTADALAARDVVKRGQQVTLRVVDTGIQVQMHGTALADGAAGERIPVRNESSSRTVEGVVRSADLVEVRTP